MPEIIASEWTDIGNGECSAIVEDTAQPGNYRSVCVRPIGRRSWAIEINGAYRGSRMTKSVAKVDAIGCAKAQLGACT